MKSNKAARAALVAGISGAVLLIVGIALKIKRHTSISIIGSADGPTSIFLAGKINYDGLALPLIAAAVLLLLACVWLAKKERGDRR